MRHPFEVRPTAVGHPRELCGQALVVHVLRPVVGVVGHGPVALQQVEGHGRHSPQGNLVPSTRGIPAVRLFCQGVPAEEGGREVDGVAVSDVLCLDGGEHGMNPACVAPFLVLHRGDGQHHIGVETPCRGLGSPLLFPAGGEQDGGDSDDEEGFSHVTVGEARCPSSRCRWFR